MKPSRREFLGGAVAVVSAGLCAPKVHAQAGQTATAGDLGNLVLVNGRIHTMDRGQPRRLAGADPQRPLRGGRQQRAHQGNAKVVDLRGRTVIPGHHRCPQPHRPGRQPAGVAHAARARLHDPRRDRGVEDARAEVPGGEFITTIGPISAMQFAERRLPNLTELDAVTGRSTCRPRRAARGPTAGARRGSKREASPSRADGTIAGEATGTRAADSAQGTADSGHEKALGVRTRCSTTRSSASRPIATRARSTPTSPRTGIASENTYTMHEPFLALNREGRMPARLRIDFLHQDPPNANPPLPTLVASSEELVPVLRQRLDEDRRHRRVHGRRAGRPAGDRTGRLARRGSRAEPGRRHQPHREPRDRERGDPDHATALDHLAHPGLHRGTGEPRARAGHGRARRLGTAAHRHERRTAVPDAVRPRHQDGLSTPMAATSR